MSYWTWTDENDRRIGGAHATRQQAIEDARQCVEEWTNTPKEIYLVLVSDDGTRTKIERI